MKRGECPHHPQGEYRECYHVGDEYVAVHWAEWLGDWISRQGTLGKRGSISARANDELPYMLERIGWAK